MSPHASSQSPSTFTKFSLILRLVFQLEILEGLRRHSLSFAWHQRKDWKERRLPDPYKLQSQVILVGHDFGGACISHAMEMFPKRADKAYFCLCRYVKEEDIGTFASQSVQQT